MSNPRRFIVRMSLFLIAVLIAAGGLLTGLSKAFLANPMMNGLILGVLMLGIILNYRQVLRLKPEIAWVMGRKSGALSVMMRRDIRLLAPLAAAMREEGGQKNRSGLTPATLRALMDGLAARLDESRDISRYFIGLMIFLGLLGTFWGLSQTVGAIGLVISSLSIPADGVAGIGLGTAFESLKQGLAAPLSGMGTAFSSSLFGLSGSLILGFLDLQAGQAQNAFFNELEDHLAEEIEDRQGPISSVGEGAPVAYLNALQVQTNEALQALTRLLSKSEEGRAALYESVHHLNEKLAILTDLMKAEQSLLARLAEHQMQIAPVFAKMAEAQSAALDDATRGHIRNLDVGLSSLGQDIARGREAILAEIRSETRLLARTIANAAEDVIEGPR